MSDATPRAVIVNDTRVDRHHGCTRVMRAIEALAVKSGLKIISTAPAHRDWRGDPAFVAAFGAADVVIVNGEGTLHHDRPAGAALLAAGAEAKARGIPAALVNATWQANGAAFGERLADFAIVSAREALSRAEMQRWRDDVRLAPDLSLLLPGPPAATARAGVGFVDSVVPDVAIALDRARRRLGGTPLPIGFAAPGMRGRLLELRHSVSLRQAFGKPRKTLETLARVTREMPHQTRSDDAYLASLAARALVVTGRFHAMMLALVAGTPVLIADSNSHKMAAVAADASLDPGRLIDPSRLDAAALAHWSHWRPDEVERVRAYVEDGRAAMRALFADITALARARRGL